MGVVNEEAAEDEQAVLPHQNLYNFPAKEPRRCRRAAFLLTAANEASELLIYPKLYLPSPLRGLEVKK